MRKLGLVIMVAVLVLTGLLAILTPQRAAAEIPSTWNTFLGSGRVSAFGSTVDSAGNTYVTGYSENTWGSPIRPYTSACDAFVAKLDNNGNLLWNTFLGSDGYDYAENIAVDGNGNVYVCGHSNASWGAPIRSYTSGLGDYLSFYDGFVTKLDTNGGLLWNTFLGGDRWDSCYGIAVDGSSNLYVTGQSNITWGSPIQSFTATTDDDGLDGNAFVTKLDNSGNLTWNTFMGGINWSSGRAISVDDNQNIYIAGGSFVTWGSPIRAFCGSQDGFVAKLASNGEASWNTFLGGDETDRCYGIAVDSDGSMYAIGQGFSTWGSPFRPFTLSGNNKYSDAFVAKLDANGNLNWNTFLGGNGNDVGSGLALDDSGNVYIAGTGAHGDSWGSPIRPLTESAASNGDAFVGKLDREGGLTWNTFLGGDGWDDGNGIGVDTNGNVYVAGSSTWAWGCPIEVFVPSSDAFVAKLDSGGTIAEHCPPLPPPSTPLPTPSVPELPTILLMVAGLPALGGFVWFRRRNQVLTNVPS